MLEHLDIKNFALIENLSIDFSEGFNVITGETGSGKSIILGALGLLMGEKASTSSIRTGCDELVVNGIISVPENHEIIPWLKERSIEVEDGAISIRRTVKSNGGRSMVYVQGQLLPRQDLVVIADSLIDMHGQSEHQSLLISDKQRKILDGYAQVENLLEKVRTEYDKIKCLEEEKRSILDSLEESQRQQDYLEYALKEIESASLQIGEDEELKNRIRLLSSYENIHESISLSQEKLKTARASLYEGSSYCSKAMKGDSTLQEYYSRIESLRIECEDISEGLGSYVRSIDYSEELLNQLQERLVLIQKLKRKYGPEIEDVLAFMEKAKNTLDLANNSQFHLDKCEKALNESKDVYFKESLKLYEKRCACSKKLEKEIQRVLKTLGMPNAVFSIAINHTDKIASNGGDTIAFLISPNTGEPLKELSLIASGGELSRVMLALKTVLAKADSIETQVFDEVDTGIGGSVALSLASCMGDLSKAKQVIAVTHLASIASVAQTQYVVYKTVENNRTYTHLKKVEGEERVREISRMLSGDESEVSLAHARNLLNSN
ncbi:MAG: DNA repair protein RecN [Sphaerochaetaceae bacterium]|nr:DNA repair protein RecN [Sphaerochaetaceae bacterium]